MGSVALLLVLSWQLANSGRLHKMESCSGFFLYKMHPNKPNWPAVSASMLWCTLRQLNRDVGNELHTRVIEQGVDYKMHLKQCYYFMLSKTAFRRDKTGKGVSIPVSSLLKICKFWCIIRIKANGGICYQKLYWFTAYVGLWYLC